MVQNLIVGLVVLGAALYSLWMLMPGTVRRAAAAGLASLARRGGLGERESQRLQAKLATHSSCGDCDSCKGCATPVRPMDAIVAVPQPGGSRRTSSPRSSD